MSRTHFFVDRAPGLVSEAHVDEFRANFVDSLFHGTAIQAEGKSVEQILVEAGLDWTVETSHFRYGQNFEHYCNPKDAQISYRSDTGELFGLVKNRQVWQNKDVVSHFANICKGMNLNLTAVGSLAGGKDLYAAAYLDSYNLGGDDNEFHQTFIILRDSHRTGKGLSIGLQEVRIVCINGVLRPIRSELKVINHVGEIKFSLMEQIVENALNQTAQTQKTHEQLANVGLSPEQATLQLIAAFGVPGNQVDDQPKIVKNCLDLYLGKAVGGNSLAAYNTAYGLLQSVTEHYNHHTRTRSESNLMTNIYQSYSQKMLGFESQLVGVFCQ